jgi:hypothetical protein
MLTPSVDGIALAGGHNVVQGNIITGPTSTGGSGIHFVGKFALETTIISGNTIKDVANALFLEQTFQGLTASTFGAQISLNNFTGYTTAVRAVRTSMPLDPSYTLPSELSVGKQGNYWGLMCPPAGPGFDPAKVDPANPQVIDSHPFGDSALMHPC